MNHTTAKQPWYTWAHRWNQCNLSEADPRDCDLAQWRRYWRKNNIQGTIINAAGTIGYFPSKNKYQYLAKYLDGKDFFKEFSDAAREEGLAIIARMDANQAAEALLLDRPEWFCRNKDGSFIPAASGRYYTCVNGGYYTEQLSEMIREVIERYHPDAMADNSWAGRGNFICYCNNCKEKFSQACGLALPERIDFQDPTFRIWLDWNRRRRTELYAWFNDLSTSIGGKDCVYLAMLHPDAYCRNAVEMTMDYTEFGACNKAVMIDGQIRLNAGGFDANTLQGLATHEIFGDDTLVIESVAAYHMAPDFMRKSANTKGETESWMRAALIAGVSPSVHFIGSVQEDRRIFTNGEDIFQWHVRNEEYLYHRHPISNVGLLRSLRNTYYYGMDRCADKTIAPMNGFVNALKRGRIPYSPIDIRQLPEKADQLKLLILPDLAVLTDEEIRNLRTFILHGGSIILTGATGMLDEYGYPRKDFPLDDLLGISREEDEPLDPTVISGIFADSQQYGFHNYVRIKEPHHPIFRGFEQTSILELHGIHYHVTSDRLAAIAIMIPPFPVYPPETAYMADHEHDSSEGAIWAGETEYGGRVVYFAADFDRRNGQNNFPDHGNLLKNTILWALNGDLPFTVKGPGELSCVLYRQPQHNRLILQMLNHSGLGKWPGSVEEYYTVGPLSISIPCEKNVQSVTARNADRELSFSQKDGLLMFTLPSIYDQELLVIQLD